MIATLVVANCAVAVIAIALVNTDASWLRLIGAGLLIAVSSAGFVWVGAVSRRDLRVPLARLATAVRRVEEGTYDVDDVCWVRGGDYELKDLVRGVHRLASTLRGRAHEHRSIQSSMRRMNEVRDQVLSSISHELRTPVTSIVAYTEMLAHMSDLDDERRVEFAQVVHRESKRLSTSIESVLDMAAYASGDASTAKSTIAVSDLVSSAVREAESDGLSGLGVQVVLSGMEDATVHLDVTRTQKALRSLLDNAVRFSPVGANVLVRFLDPKRGETAILEVEDRGTGVSAVARAFVFDLFRQGGEVLNDKPEGLGLGLPLARVCMRAQGGDVGLLRSDENGSVFRLLLPPDSVAAESGERAKPVVVAERRRPL